MVNLSKEESGSTNEFNLESARLFSDIFYKSPVTLSISTPFEGKLIDVNESFLQSTEYTRDEVIGKTSIELGLFADLKDREKLIEMLKTDNHILSYECRFRTKSGKEIFGLVSIALIQINGKPYQFTTVIDINTRIRAEEKIRDQFKELRRWHEVMLNREKRIIELKREVNDLLVSNGMPIRYQSVEDGPNSSQKMGNHNV